MYDQMKVWIEEDKRANLMQYSEYGDSPALSAAQYKCDLERYKLMEELAYKIDDIYERVEYLYNHGKGFC